VCVCVGVSERECAYVCVCVCVCVHLGSHVAEGAGDARHLVVPELRAREHLAQSEIRHLQMALGGEEEVALAGDGPRAARVRCINHMCVSDIR